MHVFRGDNAQSSLISWQIVMRHYFFGREKMYWATLQQRLLIFTGGTVNSDHLHCYLFTNVPTSTLSQLYLTIPGCSNNICLTLEHVSGWNCKLYELNVNSHYIEQLSQIHEHIPCHHVAFVFCIWYTINQTSQSKKNVKKTKQKKQQLICQHPWQSSYLSVPWLPDGMWLSLCL